MGSVMNVTTPKISLDTLRDCIAEGIAVKVKAYNVPAVCVRVGIQKIVESDDVNEAYSSRRSYIKKRLTQFDQSELLLIAEAILKEFDIPDLADVVSELTVHAIHRITEITRKDIVKNLNDFHPLCGDVKLFDVLNIISSKNLSYNIIDSPLNSLSPITKDDVQNYMNNPNYLIDDLLIRCDALTCSQTKFFTFLEKLLHPIIRRGDEQVKLVEKLNVVLKSDGFQAVVVGEQSTYPIYAIKRMVHGVVGAVKNLIFASIGPKPELVFRDAINNDIEITKHADMCLVFDSSLPVSGLSWLSMVEWWQERMMLSELDVARKSLGERLKDSVKHSGSPGEYAIFCTYYKIFVKKFGTSLPALIPQVYLHYDAFTQKDRMKLGKDKVLERERMDFLMLLDNRVRIVIEVDGKQHYSNDGKASPTQYAKMVTEDRRLRLLGYELYRFGGAEFADVENCTNGGYIVGQQSEKLVIDFFERLFDRHKLSDNHTQVL